MSIGKLAVLAVALVLVSAGVGAALADWSSPEPGPTIDLVDVDARKDDDGADGALVTEQEGDGDDTAGNDGTAGGQDAPQPQAQLAGDGDNTAGDDGTAGGAAEPAPVQPAQAGADDDAADDDAGGAGGAGGGGAGGGGGDDEAGGGDTD